MITITRDEARDMLINLYPDHAEKIDGFLDKIFYGGDDCKVRSVGVRSVGVAVFVRAAYLYYEFE